MKSGSMIFTRPVSTVILASIYSLAYVVTPYWRNIQPISAMNSVILLTISIGFIWLFLSTSEVSIRVKSYGFWRFGILLAVLIFLNYQPIQSVIPWRGDEDYHIRVTIRLVDKISLPWILVFCSSVSGMFYLAWQRSKWTIPLGLFLITGTVLIINTFDPLAGIRPEVLFRYPFFNYWFFALLPKLALSAQFGIYQEFYYRVIPLIAVFFLAYTFQIHSGKFEQPVDLIWGVAVLTIPLVLYYSSILYLELPPLLLMTIVCINAESLLQNDYSYIKQSPTWYALILIGFFKETTTLFLLCFWGWRIISTLAKMRVESEKLKPRWRQVIEDFYIGAAILLPAVFFLFLRSFQTGNRNFSPKLLNLLDLDIYSVIIGSFVEQIGLFMIPFIVGIVILMSNKKYFTVGFLLSTFLLYPLFYASDNPDYSGYSRFNVFILAPALAASRVAVERLIPNRKRLAIFAAGVIIGTNTLMSPINLDGTKKPFWGNYHTDTSEHYYPYREAIEWLKLNHRDDKILFTGLYYPYSSLAFYFEKYGWFPDSRLILIKEAKDQDDDVSEAFALARAGDFDVILYHVLGNRIPEDNTSAHFLQEKTFINDAHILIVYSK